MKLVKKVHKGETVSGYFAYLNQLQTITRARSTAKTAEDFASIDQVEEALKVLSSICVAETVKAINSTEGSKKQITNEKMALDIVKMAQLHIKVMTFLIFREHIKDFADKNLQGHMTNCCTIMGLNWLQEYTIFGYDAGYF
jgi:regulator of PEP synthase PpsR (kinase-PPPase family)